MTSSNERTIAGIEPAQVLQEANQAFIVMDTDGLVRGWNRSAERIFGWRREEALGGRLSELIIPSRYRELHERGLRSYLETGIGPVLGTTIEIEGIDRDGHIVPVELTITPTTTADGARIFHAFLHDVTHRRRIERYLRADARAAWLFADADDQVALAAILAAIGEEMYFEVGVAWQPDAGDEPELELRAHWAPDEHAEEFVAESRAFRFIRGTGMPGTAWAEGAPLWSDDVTREPRYTRSEVAERLGYRSGLFVPLMHDGTCFGVLEFLSVESQAPSADLLGRFAELGARIAGQLAQQRQD